MDVDQATLPPFDLSIKPAQADSFTCLSPDSLYSYSLEEYHNFANSSYNTDFSADSPLSLGSPVSPTTSCINPSTTVLSASPIDVFDNSWTSVEVSDAEDLAFVKPEPADSPLVFAFPSPASPAIDPVQLSGNNFHSLAAVQQKTYPSDMPSPRRNYMRRSSAASTGRKASVPSVTPSNGSLKRKSPSSASSASDGRSPPMAPHSANTYEPPKKTAHNLIEKRYRTNLNDKILALRDSVPSLRVAARHADAPCSDDDELVDGSRATGEDLGGLAPAHKLNKATILGKATEYIAYLERRNELLSRENETLRGKVDDYEMFVMSRRCL